MAGTLLQKDVRLVADVAESATVTGVAVLDAADATLSLMEHPR
jgi:3-hydroxyisobutyrate dehydrogenase